MSEQSPRLNLPFIQPSQAQKHVTHNEAIEILDIVVQLRVEDINQSDPPTSPNEGQAWAVSTTPNGAWTGQQGMIATWQNNGWLFVEPAQGWIAWVASAGRSFQFDGSDWVHLIADSDLNNISGLGVNALSDVANPLSISGPASLFSHSGSSHQIKINKANPTDTASLLFQTNFAGRAELGLNGSEDVSIKVSSDGTNWSDVLILSEDRATASQVVNFEPQATPVTANTGDVYYDSSSNKLRCF